MIGSQIIETFSFMLQIREKLQLQHIIIRASDKQRNKLHNSNLTTSYEPINRRFHSSSLPCLPGPPLRPSVPFRPRDFRKHIFPEPQGKGTFGGGQFFQDQFLRG